MFDTLTERLTQSLRNVTGSGQLTEDNIKDTLREVRMALLEADVALPVTREFIAKVKEEALGQEVMTQLSPGQAFVKIVHDELTKMMGEANESLDLAANHRWWYCLPVCRVRVKPRLQPNLHAFCKNVKRKSGYGVCRRLSSGCDQAVTDSGWRSWRDFP